MRKISLTVLVLVAAVAAPARAESELTLQRSFIERVKNRVTVTTDFLIDKPKDRANKRADDGDLHVAGRPGDEIGLMAVAEIQNAGDDDVKPALDFVQANADTGSPVRMSGIWRIWFEHAGGSNQVQGETLAKAKGTNPDHVFEIHPVTRVGDIDVLHSLRPIPGYTKPDNTMQRLDMIEHMNASLRIDDEDDTVTIRTGGNKPNYIHFIIKMLPGDHGFQRKDNTWTQPSDGKFIFAKIYDLDEELRVHKRRIAFVKGSEPFRQAEALQPNRCLNVLGITRVNLELISWRIRNAKKRPEVLGWNLPYELVAVGVEGPPFHCAPTEDE
jgi:hypothetical protein